MTLYVLRIFDPWSSPLCTCPKKYSLHPYTGCSHMCLYCYATSYIGVKRSVPKKNFIKRLMHDLKEADPSLPINMSTSSDPYPPEEKRYLLTRRTLQILVTRGYKILITTKSDLVIRDLDLISEGNVAVTLTITTLDDEVSGRLEPNAPPPRRRLDALVKLAESGVPVGVRIDPVIPYINSDEEMLRELVRRVVGMGAKFIVTSTYKAKPDNLARMIRGFPEYASRLKELYSHGPRVRGYRYLPLTIRKKLLRPIVDEAKELAVGYATCREGLTSKSYFNAASCDGTHLIPIRHTPSSS